MKWLLTALTLLSLNAQAQKYNPTSFDIPPVLSFDQLMYLPDAKRIEYIKDVRLALAAVEASMIKGAKDSNRAELDLWKEEIHALLRNLGEAALPSAHAADCISGYEYDDTTGRCLRQKLTSVRCRWNETQFSSGGRNYCQPKPQPQQPTPDAPQVVQQAPAQPPVAPALAIRPAQRPNTLLELQKNPPALPAELGGVNPKPTNRPGPTPASEEALVKERGYRTVELPNTCKKREESKNYHADAKSAYDAREGKDAKPATPYRNCLMGGMFSEYNNGEVKAGNCKKIQVFPPGTAEGAEKLSCKGKKAMCNPMLYCGPKKGEAHCIAVTQNLTKDCEKKASNKCDPFNGETLVPGAQAQWKEFAEDMNKLCGGDRAGKRFNEYFCEECTLLKKRMEEIKKKYAAYTANMPATVPPATVAPTNAPANGSGSGNGVRERTPDLGGN